MLFPVHTPDAGAVITTVGGKSLGAGAGDGLETRELEGAPEL
jgi:hypothetical protein